MSYSLPVNLLVILSFGSFMFYMWGVKDTLIISDKNECEMTYMFEFPQFVEIPLPQHIRKTSTKYGLFGYAEGGYTERLRRMKFKGIPVLFIPGSSGSYKQGRSLASVSLRKTLGSRADVYFDYFMIDFDEEQSALYGGNLELQAKFVRQCIAKILSFYAKNENKPNSVILIGHSMGGLIAKSVLIDPHFPREKVQLIITLATPLKAPVLTLDSYMTSFYDNVQLYWEKNKYSNDTTLVSIGGGDRDLIVRSDLTYDEFGHVNALTTAIPGVWCSTDHLSIVWCRQLMVTIIRAIFDCIDDRTNQLIQTHKARYDIFRYHLLKRTNGKSYTSDKHPKIVDFQRESFWYENMLRQFSVADAHGTKINSYVMFRLNQDPKYPYAFVEGSNLSAKDWVFVCKAHLPQKNGLLICDKGENLSNLTEIAPGIPGSRLKRKFVHLHLPTYKKKNYTHVVVNIPKSAYFVQLNVDIHDKNVRTINYTVPSMINLLPYTIIPQTSENSVYYKINLIGFESIWQGFSLSVETISCKSNKNNAVISFIIPWAAQHNHFYIYDKSPLTAKLTLKSRKHYNIKEPMYPYVRLSLEPSCYYKVTIQSSPRATASQMVLYHTQVLPAYILTVMLLIIREQILHSDEVENVFFHMALCSIVARYYLIVQSIMLTVNLLEHSAVLSFLPKPDINSVEILNVDFFLVNTLMYGVAIIITYSSGIAVYASIVITGKIAKKIVNRTATGYINYSDNIALYLQQIPVLTSAILVSLAITTSGALAMCIGAVFYFLRVSNMYELFVKDVVHYSINFIISGMKDPDEIENEPAEEEVQENANPEVVAPEESEGNGDESDNSAAVSESDVADEGFLWNMHFHISLFLLWCLISLLNVPSLIVWTKNYQNSFFLENDPALVPSVVIHICASVLWQTGITNPSRRMSNFFATIYFALAVLSVMYGSVSMYRLSYIISVAVLTLTINQLISRFTY